VSTQADCVARRPKRELDYNHIRRQRHRFRVVEFSAAPGSESISYSGTITVMSQVLTVIVGSSVGTPGTGTLTIQGSAHEGLSCPTKYDCSTVWESGDVYVTIAGVTFGAGYSGTPRPRVRSHQP
jgi:hypothetical protein